MRIWSRLHQIWDLESHLAELIGRQQMRAWLKETRPICRKGRSFRERLVIRHSLLLRAVREARVARTSATKIRMPR